LQEIILWRKQEKDKDKGKQSAQQYAHYERPEATNKADNNGNLGDNSPGNGPLSSGNNSDTPSD
jgi:hypothetical protein